MKLRALFFTLLASLVLASCGNKGGKTGLLVPKDALVVIHVNGSSLSSKLSWQEIQQSQWYQAVQKKLQSDQHTDSVAMKIFENPELSGVDVKSDLVYYAVNRGKNVLLVASGKLADAAKFESFLKQAGTTGTPAVKDGINTITMEGRAVVSWDKNRWLALGTIPAGGLMAQGDDFGMADVTISSDTLRAYGQDLLGLKGSKLLDADKRFADLVTDGKDLHVWFNTEAYFNLAMKGRMGMLSMLGNMGDMVKDNIATYSINFDNGKITADSRHYYGDKMSSIFKKYEGKAVSEKTAGLLPADSVVVAGAINYQPEFIREFITNLGLDGLLNMAMAQSGFGVDDFVRANAGDVIFAVSNFGKKAVADSAGGRESVNADFTFGVSVKDKAAFENLITLLWKRSGSKDRQLTYKLENNWFAASTTPANVDKILSGNSTKADYINRITGHPLGIYINLQRLVEESVRDATDTTGKKVAALASAVLRELLINGGEFSNKAMTMHAELTMADANTNSLKQLNTLLDSVYLNSKDRLEELQTKMDQNEKIPPVILEEEKPATGQKNN